MKKILLGLIIMILLLGSTIVYGTSVTSTNKGNNAQESRITGAISTLKEKSQNELDSYIERYGSESYGLTAYILKKVQIYSIPFCFLGVALSAIYQYIIGIRKLDTRDKGFYSLVGFVTLFVICQLLPLVFAIVIKGWRG